MKIGDKYILKIKSEHHSFTKTWADFLSSGDRVFQVTETAGDIPISWELVDKSITNNTYLHYVGMHTSTSEYDFIPYEDILSENMFKI